MTRDLPVVAADGHEMRSSALNRRVLIGVIIAAVLLGPTLHLVQRPLTVVAAFQLAATVCLTALVLWRFGPTDSVPKATPWAVIGMILALAITLYAVGGQAWLGTLAIGAAVCGRLSRTPGSAIQKLGARNRAAAVAVAQRKGWL